MSTLAERFSAKSTEQTENEPTVEVQVTIDDVSFANVQADTVHSSTANVQLKKKTIAIGKVELPYNEEVSPEDIKYVPESNEYIDTKRMLETVAHGIVHNLPVLLIGETGVGKTSAIRYLASKCNMPFRRLNLNGSTTVDEFVGKVMLDKDGTYWVDGILIDAMRRGHWLVVDEINAALPEILFVLQSLLDDDRYVVLAESDGEVVRPHANFRLFATMNPSDGGYTGTKELNKALMSRFSIVLNVDYPTVTEEKRIVEKRYPNRNVVTKEKLGTMIKFTNDMRTAYGKGAQDFVISPRDLLTWVHMSEVLGDIATAAEVTLVNKARKEERQGIADILKLHFGLGLWDYAEQAQLAQNYEIGDKLVMYTDARGTTGTVPEDRTDVILVEVLSKETMIQAPENKYLVKVLASNTTKEKNGLLNNAVYGSTKNETKVYVLLEKHYTAKYHGSIL